MKHIYFIILLFICCPLRAQEIFNERVFVHLDKNCYVAGEDIWMKFLVVDNHFNPSDFSKVGYVEICDSEKPHVQAKLVLDKGKGWGRVTIPMNIPSGVYELSGYTRYMRNESEDAVFRKQIAVVNMAMPSEFDRVELIEPEKKVKQKEVKSSNIQVTADKKEYANRHRVHVSLDKLPANMVDLVVSVRKNDSITYLPGTDTEKWSDWVSQIKPMPDNWKWQPEYEGHIIIGKANLTPGEAQDADIKSFSTGIGFVGSQIRYTHGQLKNQEGLTYFYTGDVYGPQEIVTSAASQSGVPYRMDIVSPFAESLPKTLPALQLCAEDKQLMDRFVGVQLKQIVGVDSLERQVPLRDYYYFRTPVTYDLDEYTRFNTLGETFIEFILRIIVRKSDGGKRVLKVLIPSENRFSSGNTLVLLDGVPIRDHEDILKYNPRNIKKVYVYEGKYLFGEEMFECMVSFVTHRQNLPSIQLSDGSQLFAYDCPSLPIEYTLPDYANDAVRKSIEPDFRHTLYWNPSAESTIVQQARSASFSFFTSDLCGDFEIVVEGFTKDGTTVYGTTHFQVVE